MKKLIEKALSTISTATAPWNTYVVGMSGGVDSSVAAFLLKEAGFHVIGCFMKNWDEKDDREICTQESDYQDVAQVSRIIDIPYYSVNFTKEYKEEVFELFLHDLKNGLTPNPDILCNKEIKFKRLLEKAITIGHGGLATGHYAKRTSTEDGLFLLEKPSDLAKDQTYFLYTATQYSLQHTLFPLENLSKQEVRQIAKHLGLSVHNKKDSTGICFIGERHFRSFLSEWIGTQPGKMIDDKGRIVGEHIGLAFYTIGQRKGLGIGGPGDAWFVAEKRIATNELIVVQGENNPLLFAKTLIAKDAHFINVPKHPVNQSFICSAKIRYRQPDQRCTVLPKTDGCLLVTFDEPQRAITPQQSIVFYDNTVCLGGATIVCAQ